MGRKRERGKQATNDKALEKEEAVKQPKKKAAVANKRGSKPKTKAVKGGKKVRK